MNTNNYQDIIRDGKWINLPPAVCDQRKLERMHDGTTRTIGIFFRGKEDNRWPKKFPNTNSQNDDILKESTEGLQ